MAGSPEHICGLRYRTWMLIDMGGSLHSQDEAPPTDRTISDETMMEKLAEFITRGKKDGFVTPDDVAAALLAAELPAERSDIVLRLLADDGVEVLDEVDDDASATPGRRREREELAFATPTSDPVRMYLTTIGRVRLLTADEEVDLAKRIEAGLFASERLAATRKASPRLRQDLEAIEQDGQIAKRKLVEANLRLVVSIAKRYVGRGMLMLDLIQEGNLGLIRAVEKFDYAKATSSPPTPPGGFGRLSRGRSRIRVVRSGFRYTWPKWSTR